MVMVVEGSMIAGGSIAVGVSITFAFCELVSKREMERYWVSTCTTEQEYIRISNNRTYS